MPPLDPLADLCRVFSDRAGGRFAVARAPGRVNLLGEHTDYNEGYVLPAATSQATYVACRPRDDLRFRIWTAAFDAHDEFVPEELVLSSDVQSWRRYVRGVIWALGLAAVPLRGMDAVIVGDLPIGVGMASSAAVEVAVALAALDAAEHELDPVRVALLCQQAENEFVGMRCGVLDHFASLLGQADTALLLDCRTYEVTRVSLAQPDVAFVVCDTTKPRALVSSEYNARRAQCEAAARQLGVRALRDLTLDALVARRSELGEEVFRRARHVVTENERVLMGMRALQAGDFTGLGQLLRASHASLRDDYEVSCPELDVMVEIAAQAEGCLGARLMGAGFGGSALALVTAEAAEEFCRTVADEYRRRTGLAGRTYVTRPSPGAAVIQRGET